MSLAHSIWAQVREQVQAHRLDSDSADRGDGADASGSARRLAATLMARLEADALDRDGAVLSDAERAWIGAELDSLLGAGPLQRLLDRDDVENVWLFGPRRGVLGLADGRQEALAAPLFADDAEMIAFIAHLAVTHGQTGRRFDHSAPLLDLRLRTGQRLFAAMDVCGTPFVTIRCHRHRLVTLADLVDTGTLDSDAAQFLAAAVRPPPRRTCSCAALWDRARPRCCGRCSARSGPRRSSAPSSRPSSCSSTRPTRTCSPRRPASPTATAKARSTWKNSPGGRCAPAPTG